MEERVIVLADKTVLKVTGVRVKGLRPVDVERVLSQRLGTLVRVIGVTGRSIDMDVYGLPPEALLQDEEGTISALSAVEGIQASEVAQIASARRAVDVHVDHLPGPLESGGCRAERWRTGNADA